MSAERIWFFEGICKTNGNDLMNELLERENDGQNIV